MHNMHFPKAISKEALVIPENYIRRLEQKNYYFLRKIFIFSLTFGLFCTFLFAIVGNIVPSYMRPDIFYYYTMFTVLGLIGLFLTESKIPCKILFTYVMICLEIIFIVILYESSIANCLVCFLGLSFICIIILDVNPYVFTVFIIQALAIIYFFQKYNIFAKPQKNDSFTVVVINIIVLFLILIVLVFWKRHQVLAEFRREDLLYREQTKTENLLTNIFPSKVINQMKLMGASTAETFSNVTVFHSDIIDFTKTTSSLEPELVINELNEVFSAFDEITEKYECMRVKTIGDAYVAVCGIPEADGKHAEKMISCAQSIISYLNERNKKSPIKWKIRCGIASGSVIAGVVGLRRYIYDVFGNASEKALRIQEKGKPMLIAIDEETYSLVKDSLEVEKGEGCYYIIPEQKSR